MHSAIWQTAIAILFRVHLRRDFAKNSGGPPQNTEHLKTWVLQQTTRDLDLRISPRL